MNKHCGNKVRTKKWTNRILRKDSRTAQTRTAALKDAEQTDDANLFEIVVPADSS